MTQDIEFVKLTADHGWPNWCSRNELVEFLHETMKPYQDSPEDISAAVDYAFSEEAYAGGFVMLASLEGMLAGALVMLNSGMGGYIPENILLFVSINPDMRGKGIGGRLINHCIANCEGDVKLHVDFDNPAKRLYERIGFRHQYDEMRYRQ